MQGRKRVLEDHGDTAAAQCAHPRLRQGDDLIATEPDFAGDQGARALVQAEQGEEVTDLPEPDSPTMPRVRPF
ncbi:hypothetical protein GCM10025734_00690 [Kitasatospora paranensis]